MILRHARILGLFLVITVAACGDGKQPTPVDSATQAVPPPPPAVTPSVNPGWERSSAGPAMLLSVADNSAGALVVLPMLTDSMLLASPEFDLDSISGMQVELLSRAGLAGSTTLIIDPRQRAPEGCLSWPAGRLADIPERSWRIGFLKGSVIPLPMDSLEGMTPADSFSVTREIARLSSALAEGDDPAFRGLPFTVRKAYRFALPAKSVLVGNVIRMIAEEANPREERLLLIAERPAASNAEYSAVFHSRVAGTEDVIRTSEILGAIRFVRGGNPAIVVAFEYEDGGRIALVQRVSSNEWKVRWRSAYTGC